MFGNGTTLISLRDFGGTKNNNGMMLMVTFTGWSNEAFAMDLLEAVGAATKQEFLDALKWVSGDQYWDRGGGLSANFSTDENLWLEK